MSKSLITPHSKQTGHIGHEGGSIGAVDTLIHYDHLGNGKVDAVVEYRQDIEPIAIYNAVLRGTDQGSWGDKIGRMTYNIPKAVIKKWKNEHGFDFEHANLNDPEQYRTFKKLVSLPEYSFCKTWEPRR
jgi:hypothetical protein